VGAKIDHLIALANSQVGSYTRRTKSGKTVQVRAYTRVIKNLADMSFMELHAEQQRLSSDTTPQGRKRFLAALAAMQTRRRADQREAALKAGVPREWFATLSSLTKDQLRKQRDSLSESDPAEAAKRSILLAEAMDRPEDVKVRPPAQDKVTDNIIQFSDLADEWHEKVSKKESSEGGLKQRLAALQGYTGDGYVAMNAHLRGHRDGDAEVQQQISDLDALFDDAAETPKAVSVYRGIDGSFMRSLFFDAKVGQALEDRAFLSTSIDPAEAEQFGDSQIEIQIPKGTKYLPGYGVEDELIFPRNSVLEIMEVDTKNFRVKLALRTPGEKAEV